MDPVPETDVFEAASYDSESSDCSPSGKVSISVSARYTSEDDEPHWETELRRALARLATAIVRGAGAGLTIRGGLHAASGLLHLLTSLRPRGGKARPKRGISASQAIEDTLRYTAFLGCMAGIYVGADEVIAAAWGKERTASWRSLVAGALAGPSLLLTGSKVRHYSLATYVLLRGLTLLVRTGNKPGAHPAVRALLAPSRHPHGDTLLMCLASSQILYSFLMMPQTLPTSYVRFIQKALGKPEHVVQAFRDLAHRNAAGLPTAPLPPLAKTPHQHTCSRVPCHFLHPGQGCYSHAAAQLPPAYSRALAVYLPVYLVPAALVHRHKLLQKPKDILPKVALGVARSSLFLSMFISLAFAGICTAHRSAATTTGAIVAGSVWVGGLATLVEKKSRRMELAYYCMSRALESFARCTAEWGWVPRKQLPARLDVLIFSAAIASITHSYSGASGQHRDVFRSKYLNVLDFVFGNTGVTEGRIRHVPSNADLLQSAAVKLRSRRGSMTVHQRAASI